MIECIDKLRNIEDIDKLLMNQDYMRLKESIKKPDGMSDKQYDTMIKHLQKQANNNNINIIQITS